jgi:hypothetical protein
MMADPQLNRIFLSKMTERLLRTDMLDLPRYAGLDQQMLRELRTPEPGPPPGPEPQPGPASQPA